MANESIPFWKYGEISCQCLYIVYLSEETMFHKYFKNTYQSSEVNWWKEHIYMSWTVFIELLHQSKAFGIEQVLGFIPEGESFYF